eukprot:scaffold20224_cov138-Isochrysis_galbana.AAC.2
MDMVCLCLQAGHRHRAPSAPLTQTQKDKAVKKHASRIFARGIFWRKKRNNPARADVHVHGAHTRRNVERRMEARLMARAGR